MFSFDIVPERWFWSMDVEIIHDTYQMSIFSESEYNKYQFKKLHLIYQTCVIIIFIYIRHLNNWGFTFHPIQYENGGYLPTKHELALIPSRMTF